MAELKLIHGRQSIKYNIFSECDFVSCSAVATRLMGVTALRVTWRGRRMRSSHVYQIIHLDYSEYGIDEYREFDCVSGSEDYADKRKEMTELWNHFNAVMGGEVVRLDESSMLRVIESALPLAAEDFDREYDNEENRSFRRYALLRLGLMRDALNERGITSADCSPREAVELLSPLRLAAYETINYFVMRIIDHDYEAAAYLSSMDNESLREIDLAGPGIQTLMKCDIQRSDRRKDPSADGTFPFRCRITTLARDSYYHATFVIWLSGNYRSKNPVVTDLKVGSMMKLSDIEAAMQISATEYITIFDCQDSMLNGFDSKYIGPFANSSPVAVPNGWLYTAYKGNNSHVNSSAYRLNDDVYGYALLSIGGELILMSNDVRSISMLDDATIFSMYSPFINTKGRYRLDTSVFQTLCRSPGALFEDLVEPSDD